MRVGGRFAGKVTVFEFRKGGIDVVGVEKDVAGNPPIRVGLGNTQHFDVEFALPRVAVKGPDADEGEAVPCGSQ